MNIQQTIGDALILLKIQIIKKKTNIRYIKIIGPDQDVVCDYTISGSKHQLLTT